MDPIIQHGSQGLVLGLDPKPGPSHESLFELWGVQGSDGLGLQEERYAMGSPRKPTKHSTLPRRSSRSTINLSRPAGLLAASS